MELMEAPVETTQFEPTWTSKPAGGFLQIFSDSTSSMAGVTRSSMPTSDTPASSTTLTVSSPTSSDRDFTLTPTSDTNSGLHGSAIFGIVMSGLVALLFTICCVCCVRHSKRKAALSSERRHRPHRRRHRDLRTPNTASIATRCLAINETSNEFDLEAGRPSRNIVDNDQFEVGDFTDDEEEEKHRISLSTTAPVRPANILVPEPVYSQSRQLYVPKPERTTSERTTFERDSCGSPIYSQRRSNGCIPPENLSPELETLSHKTSPSWLCDHLASAMEDSLPAYSETMTSPTPALVPVPDRPPRDTKGFTRVLTRRMVNVRPSRGVVGMFAEAEGKARDSNVRRVASLYSIDSDSDGNDDHKRSRSMPPSPPPPPPPASPVAQAAAVEDPARRVLREIRWSVGASSLDVSWEVDMQELVDVIRPYCRGEKARDEILDERQWAVLMAKLREFGMDMEDLVRDEVDTIEVVEEVLECPEEEEEEQVTISSASSGHYSNIPICSCPECLEEVLGYPEQKEKKEQVTVSSASSGHCSDNRIVLAPNVFLRISTGC